MSTFITYLQNITNGKRVLILFILTNLIYISMLMYSLPLVSSFAPELVLFDMSPMGYSYAQAIKLLTSLGAEGRNAYLSIQLPLDFIYPGLFAVSYALLITWVFKHYLPIDSKFYFIAFIPIIAGVFDYLENTTIIMMLNSFPDISENIVTISSLFTIVKSVATSLFFVTLILSFIVFFRRRKV